MKQSVCSCQQVLGSMLIFSLLADVTAKGESVANLADIGGTVAGILLSRSKLGMLPTFCLLSAGYLVASRQEVAAIQLPYLNRARLAFAARTFLQTGVVPDPALANDKEPLLPWGPYGQAMPFLQALLHHQPLLLLVIHQIDHASFPFLQLFLL